MPEPPSTARGTATSRRILDAAAEEFARRGIAGARVERIIEAARTNKAQLYGYFGSKEGLFDAVVADCVDRITTAAPFDGNDLAEWAVRLYDQYLIHPELVRLTTWVRLERRPAGLLFDHPENHAKVAAIAAAQAAGTVRAGDPVDLMAMIIAMSCAWSPVSGIYTATPDEPEADHERRRALLRDCVRRAIAP
ncbi:TetR family transcriptional regulator [Dactylosporangium sp. CA-092794]|uniref:TetR family transcriptional regulator n=1 Tax=Dactylosporangium sp. CA-092794 TaxID=3239929 RepID=UPI003D89B5B4